MSTCHHYMSTKMMPLFLRSSPLWLSLMSAIILGIGAFFIPQTFKSSTEVKQLISQQRCRNTALVYSSLKLPPRSSISNICVRTRTQTRTKGGDEAKWPIFTTVNSDSTSALYSSAVSFLSPLLEECYPPAVADRINSKPLLLYLPGFDGTLIVPFLQFPEMGTEFDVRGMTIAMDDRSTLVELRDFVLDYICSTVHHDVEGDDDGIKEREKNGIGGEGRPIYIMGESFGGILALEVAIAIRQINSKANNTTNINLQGLVLINPATSYARSQLAITAPPITKQPLLLYPFALLKLFPLLTDSYALPQLFLMLSSKALPSIIDTPQRESYMGRIALTLASRLKFMPRDTLRWRLDEWLAKGCESIARQEEDIKATASSSSVSLPILFVVGEKDKVLPSSSEAERLSDIFPDSTIHVVPGAGHASTSGSRVDLTALMRDRFPQLLSSDAKSNADKKMRRRKMKKSASEGEGKYFGMEPRYDGASIGLSPLVYWSKDNYQQV